MNSNTRHLHEMVERGQLHGASQEARISGTLAHVMLGTEELIKAVYRNSADVDAIAHCVINRLQNLRAAVAR